MSARNVLVTGGTGTVGRLAIAALLREEEDVRVIAPVRSHHGPDAVRSAVGRELASWEGVDVAWEDRLVQTTLPDGADDPNRPDPLRQLDAALEALRVPAIDEVVHCAGCLSYFDEAALDAINVELTRRVVAAATRWSVSRFVHVSTAFACGFVAGPVAERLHDEPDGDPTHYTVSKRRGERIVAESGLPFLILRPSIVVGDSRDGHYDGPRYGLYQLWSGVERFLLPTWEPEIHYVAPERRLPIVHQDALQHAFIGARRALPPGSICHVTSHDGPDVREIADLVVEEYLKPERVHYYDRLDEVPLADLPAAHRSFLRLAAVNVEISSHPWTFETTNLDRAIAAADAAGLATGGFVDASLDTVRRCQQAYFGRSRPR